MYAKLLILFCTLTVVFAYPYETEPEPQQISNIGQHEVPYAENVQYLKRVRRQQQPKFPIQLQGGGGGSKSTGFDISIDARAPVWQSPNKRHSFDATGGYSQHLGGPWGNSKPDKRIGGVYTYRF